MIGAIAKFEFRYQISGPVFWVSYGIFFLLAFGATTIDQVRIGGPSSNVHKNSPFTLIQVNEILSYFAIFLLVAFVASAIVRDDETNFRSIVRSTRITKYDYLFGRFTGAFCAAALCFSSVSAGILIGTVMPWVDAETVGPFVPSHYLFAYFVMALPTLFINASIFYVAAAITRSLMWTFVCVIGVLALYGASRALLSSPDYDTVFAYLEPMGFAAFAQATRYWTAADRNSLLPALEGPILYNRLIWLTISFCALGLAYRVFRFTDRASRAKGDVEVVTFGTAHEIKPRAHAPVFGQAALGTQLWTMTRLDMQFVFTSPAYFVLLMLGCLNSMIPIWLAGEFYGIYPYPVTRANIEILRGAYGIIPVIIAIFYAGELVWRDRDRKLHEIVDAMPVPDWMFVLPKLLALFLVLLSTFSVGVLAAIVAQLAKFYPVIELDHYILWFILPESVDAFLIAALALTAQALVPHKYFGWGVMALYIVGEITLSNMGYQHPLYLYAETGAVPLSDMNGEGRFWIARAWLQAYWGAFATLLLVLAHSLWRRGTELRFAPRFARMPRRLYGTAGLIAGGAVLVFIGCGGFIFYNTNILNTYRSRVAVQDFMADYEKTLIGFEGVAQPNVTDVTIDVDIDPIGVRVATKGAYVIENKTAAPLDHIHLRWDRNLDMVRLDIPGATSERDFGDFHYRIFRFDSPMQVGERREVTFETVLQEKGFSAGAPLTRVVGNGTFLNSLEILPVIGMNRAGLLQDRVLRRKHGLPAELRLAKLEDDGARNFSFILHHGAWVNSDITVTTRADQTPIAPGYKVSDETIGQHRRARFKSDAPIVNFFSIQSGQYAEAHDKLGNIDLTVYYHPPHHRNVQRMIKAMKTSLEVFQTVYSPYQFRQARIIEFPAYARFAQSFANTIPYSEGIGFILDETRDPDNIEVNTFITAHEMAHQWWAHQVLPADMQGGTMLVETFAQYSALLVMEKLQGPEQIKKFLKYELDRYLRARGGEAVEELPLARVENQGYIHYQKGALAMYFLKDQLGEDTINRALRKLIADFAFKSAPYATTTDFLRYLRAEAPGHDDLIADVFERITLYDIKINLAQAKLRADGKYDVAIGVKAQKWYADGQGKESEQALAEDFDVGLFDREVGRAGFGPANVIAMNRIPIKSGEQTLTLIADRMPKYAGVDPYNKRITRNSTSVIAPVTLSAPTK